MRKYFGPSTLVAAAFIGPGTLATCTLAGVTSSYTLLWAMLFSIIATLVLQEMAARLGYITKQGLGESVATKFHDSSFKYLVYFLVIGAILVGNMAYEAGNITGAVMGLQLIAGDSIFWPLLIGATSFVLLYLGQYKLIEGLLIALVIIMSLCFIVAAIMVKPDPGAILAGLFPSRPATTDQFLLVLALIGTTVVPYNLFLHASTISKKHKGASALKEVRIENAVAITLGGLISMLIIITSAATASAVTEVTSAKDLAIQLEPLLGTQAKTVIGIGLLAAGLSSTMTAPLAAAYAAKGLFGWSDNEKEMRFRSVWILVILIGVVVSFMELRSILVIKFAQITNAVLLPFIAGFLLYISNSERIMGTNKNGLFSNVMAALIIVLIAGLSINKLIGVWG